MWAVYHNRAVVEDSSPEGLLNAHRGNALKGGFGLSDVEKSLFGHYSVGIEFYNRSPRKDDFADLYNQRHNEPEEEYKNDV